MLTIKRVPTVVSNYQEDAAEPPGCGRNCLGHCCLPGSKLPLFAFKNAPQPIRTPPPKEDTPSDYFLNTLLLGQWEDRMSRGLFRYNVTACESKVIPGHHGFIAQLNEGRHLKKRPTEFRVDQVLQPFDPQKFNFTKIGQEEVLFRFEPGGGSHSHYFDGAPIKEIGPLTVVTINVSPIEHGHVLLIPRVLERLPQRIDPESFLLALHMALEAGSPYFRLGYNSLGAFATINHLHFQAYYMSALFPVEKAPTERVHMTKDQTENGVKVSRLLNYPVRALVFEGGNTLKDLSDVVAAACIWLQENNIPFNILISGCSKKIFLLPQERMSCSMQCYAKKQSLGEVSQELLDTQVNPGVWEISGHMVLKRRKDYEEASEACALRLLAEVSLSEERFSEVEAYIFEATGMMGSREIDGCNEETTAKTAAFASLIPECCLVLQ